MTQWWSPTIVRVSGDKSLPKQLFQKPDGNLECRFPKRLVLMANHQLYTDWLYLWWVAYTNNMHGYIYIILKESLKNVPIIGWGAQFYNFIFLSRKWENDKAQFQKHLDTLNNVNDPMWLLIFPEGTNLAKSTRERSKAWAEKNGLQDMKHQLLPRSLGLQFSLQRLRGTTEWLYDCTIAYEGIPIGEFGQDIFTLQSSMFEGRPPKSVNMHFRRFRIANIPLDNDKAFDVWLRNRWREKDYLLEHFVRFNRFPDDHLWMMKQRKAGRVDLVPQPAKCIAAQIKSNSLEEFMSIFAPVTSVLMALSLASGETNPQELIKSLGGTGQEGMEKLAKVLENAPQQTFALQKMLQGSMPPGFGGMGALSPPGKELAQKYLNSVRPAAAKQIDLPDRALRKPPPKKAASVSGATGKPIPRRINAAPSVVSTPAARPKNAGSVFGATGKPTPRKINAAPSVVSTPTARPKKPATAFSGASVASVPNATRAPLTAKNLASVAARKPALPTPRPQQAPSKAAGSKPVNIDPKVLERMMPAQTKQPSSKPVNIDPAVLAQMKSKGKKPQQKNVAVDPKVLERIKRGGTNTAS